MAKQNATQYEIRKRIGDIFLTMPMARSVVKTIAPTPDELWALYIDDDQINTIRTLATMSGGYRLTYEIPLFLLFSQLKRGTGASLKERVSTRHAIESAKPHMETLPQHFAAYRKLHLHGGDGIVFQAGIMQGQDESFVLPLWETWDYVACRYVISVTTYHAAQIAT